VNGPRSKRLTECCHTIVPCSQLTAAREYQAERWSEVYRRGLGPGCGAFRHRARKCEWNRIHAGRPKVSPRPTV